MSDPPRCQARAAVRKAAANRDAARRKLLAQRRKLARRRRQNRERTGEDGDRNRNPSTHSTVPPADEESGTHTGGHGSTVPDRPRYASVPPAPRLYGLRLAQATREGEDD